MNSPGLALAVSISSFLLPSIASASTYLVDFSIGDQPGDSVFDSDTQTFLTGSGAATVTGSLETDGTIGTLGSSNILFWEFTISDVNSSVRISSDADLGSGPAYSGGSFWATESEISISLSSTPVWFDESIGYPGPFGRVAYDNGWLTFVHGVLGSDPDTGSSVFENEGVYARKYVGGIGQYVFATSEPSPVPLPASAVVLLTGLGFMGCLSGLRRKNRARVL